MIQPGFLFAMVLLYWQTSDRCVVSQDRKGRVITTCHRYGDQNKLVGIASHNEDVYLGSEYYTFPVWQEGNVLIGNKDIPCKLAFSLITNEVSYQLNNATTAERVQPAAFTINGQRFVRQPMSKGGKNAFYFLVLYDGKTQFLKLIKTKFRLGNAGDGYPKADEYNGYYDVEESYYFKKKDASLEPVSLSKRSILLVLQDQETELTSRLTSKRLTTDAVIEVLKYYDTLSPE